MIGALVTGVQTCAHPIFGASGRPCNEEGMMALDQGLRDSLTLPAFAAPMFLCSGVDLAIASCKAGLIGSLTRNHCRDLEELEAKLKAVKEALATFSSRQEQQRVVMGKRVQDW